jgi:hypothetical protein
MSAVQPLEGGLIAVGGKCHVPRVVVDGNHGEFGQQDSPFEPDVATSLNVEFDPSGGCNVGTMGSGRP